MSDNKNNREAENGAIEFLGDIQSSFRGMKTCMWAMALVCVCVSVGAVWLSYRKAETAARNVFVIDQGSVLQAARADNKEQLDLEIADHVTRFHELMFNLAPNVEIINQNIARAMELADESAYDYFCDQKENEYYSRLIDLNAMQQIEVDSVSVDMKRYPYEVRTRASLYFMRESNISRYELVSSCSVWEVQRTSKNPHGLMIMNFYCPAPKLKGTRKR